MRRAVQPRERRRDQPADNEGDELRERRSAQLDEEGGGGRDGDEELGGVDGSHRKARRVFGRIEIATGLSRRRRSLEKAAAGRTARSKPPASRSAAVTAARHRMNNPIRR